MFPVEMGKPAFRITPHIDHELYPITVQYRNKVPDTSVAGTYGVNGLHRFLISRRIVKVTTRLSDGSFHVNADRGLRKNLDNGIRNLY